MNKEPSLTDILGPWLAEELPHFEADFTAHSHWLGFIRCKCDISTPMRPHAFPAIARVEHDKIVLISPDPAHYTQRHRKSCSTVGLVPCYCGEKILSIFNANDFKKLKTSLVNNHRLIMKGVKNVKQV